MPSAQSLADVIITERLRKLFKRNCWKHPSGCWIWCGGTNDDGYGRIKVETTNRKRTVQAHRVAWLLVHGDPGTLDVLHTCDRPICINTEHLYLGTNQDNMQDMTQKGHNPLQIYPQSMVDAILEDAKTGMNSEEIAKKYDMSQSNAWRIMNKRTRK